MYKVENDIVLEALIDFKWPFSVLTFYQFDAEGYVQEVSRQQIVFPCIMVPQPTRLNHLNVMCINGSNLPLLNS